MFKTTNRKADIVRTARSLFQTKDYEKSTMQDVMDILGIAKGTIYHYFRSKEALLEAVIEDLVSENIEQLQSILEEATGTALDKLKLLVKGGNMADENPNILEQLHKPANSSMHSRLLAATIVRQAPLYAAIIEQGCAEGIFKTNHPLECAEFVLSGIQFLTDMGIYPWTQEDLQRRNNAFPELLEQMLQSPSGSFNFLTDELLV